MKLTTLAAIAAVSLLPVASVFAQDTTGTNAAAPGGGNQGGNRRGGNFDPAQFQQRMNQRLKDSLKVTDEEWAVIQPLLEKVQTKQREAGGRGGMGGGGRNRGGGGQGGQGGQGAQGGQGGGPGGQQPGGSPESEALRTALASDSTSPDEIKTKLEALRESRKKATAELEQARGDLQKVLTIKQEATLVLMGVLE